MTFTSKNMLNTYLDFISLQPDRETWHETDLKDNPPSLNRLHMLHSLCDAFDLGDLKEFHEGKFILSKDKNEYDSFVSEIKSITRYRYLSDKPASLKEISDMFQALLRHRVEVEKILRVGRKINKPAGGLGLLAYDKIWQTNVELYLGMATIDSFLCTIISPSDKKISAREIIALYNAPEVDLTEEAIFLL